MVQRPLGFPANPKKGYQLQKDSQLWKECQEFPMCSFDPNPKKGYQLKKETAKCERNAKSPTGLTRVSPVLCVQCDLLCPCLALARVEFSTKGTPTGNPTLWHFEGKKLIRAKSPVGSCCVTCSFLEAQLIQKLVLECFWRKKCPKRFGETATWR